MTRRLKTPPNIPNQSNPNIIDCQIRGDLYNNVVNASIAFTTLFPVYDQLVEAAFSLHSRRRFKHCFYYASDKYIKETLMY